MIDCESEIITIRVAQEKVVFAFADEKVEGCDVFVALVFDDEFDDGEKKMKNVCTDVTKEDVFVKNDDCNDAEGTIKQACKKKRARKRRKTKKRKIAPPWLGEPYIIAHLQITLVPICLPPSLLLGGEFWVTTVEAMEMLEVSPLPQLVWFLCFLFLSELVVSCIELIDVKQK